MGFDFMASLGVFGGGLAGYIIPFLFVLTIVVFFHELGHFLVGRWCGVKVQAFSIGFGPEIVGWNDRHGTRWKLSAIPLGGYVKFVGDMNAASVPDPQGLSHMPAHEQAISFPYQHVAKRAAIVAAGPIANFILAIVIFSGLNYVNGRQMLDPRIEAVEPNSPAQAAGFQPNDVIKSIEGRPIASFADMQRVVSARADETLTFVVIRDGQPVTLQATPMLKEQKT